MDKLIVFTLAVLMYFGNVNALSVTYIGPESLGSPVTITNTDLYQTSATYSALLPKFDSSLGTLTNVQIFGTGGVSMNGYLNAAANSPSTWSINLNYSATLNVLDASDPYYVNNDWVGSLSLLNLNGAVNSYGGFGVAASISGDVPPIIDYSLGGLPSSFLNSFIASTPGELFNLIGAYLLGFSTSNAAIDYGNTALNIDSLNALGITYTFDAPLATPEPGTYFLMGSFMIAALFFSRKKQIKSC